MKAAIRLISTDFDGTLVEHGAIPPVAPEFFQALAALRAQGVLWAVNTGRVLWHIEAGLREFDFDLEPDYVLTSEREVFHRGPDGKWQDYGDWNKRCAADHDWLFSQASPLLADIHAEFDGKPWAHFERDGERLVGIVTETDAQRPPVGIAFFGSRHDQGAVLRLGQDGAVEPGQPLLLNLGMLAMLWDYVRPFGSAESAS